MRVTLAALCAAVVASGALIAQSPSVGLTTAQIAKPAPDSWPTYNGDYSGRRYSTLTKITAANVNVAGATLTKVPEVLVGVLNGGNFAQANRDPLRVETTTSVISSRLVNSPCVLRRT